MFILAGFRSLILYSSFNCDGDKVEMALTNTEADCRFLRDRIESLEVKIKILREQIQSNFEILNQGVGNRVRARIEDGIFN